MRTDPHKVLPYAHALRILESIAAGVFTVDRTLHIRYFNRTAARITGIPPHKAIGRLCCDILRCGNCETDCALRHAMRNGKETVNKHCRLEPKGGRSLPVSITAAALRDSSGKIVGGVESFRDLSAIEALQKELRRSYAFEDIVSKNNIMQGIFDILPSIAESDSTILIQGPSGTGKELVARAIHNLSHRKAMPFVAVNCGALPDTLLESELFGYVRGAFTDAHRDKKGRFALAQGGTIFLDEVESLYPATQIVLLRVLEEKEYFPLGATVAAKANVRVLAATKEDLACLVDEGRFRNDLYFRLNVLKLELPRLAERRDDIPLLVDHFIEKFSQKMMRSVRAASPEVMAVLMRHEFPGNVRELQNIIEHAVVMSKGEELQLHHLPPELATSPPSTRPDARGLLDLAQRDIIMATMKKNDWNRMLAARELGISRTTLWRKCVRFGLTLPRVSNS
jgi:PAS domain S-box-containing protein